VNCEEYITNYLSAQADGELTPEEEREVAQHLGSGPADGCAVCRSRLAEERVLKALIKRQAATIKSPSNGVSAIPASEAFDQAVYSYETFETAFRPTVPSYSLSAIAMAYGSAEMPDLMWNFQFAGYGVVGGRIDRLPDGNPVTYTLYHGRNSDILCTRYKASDFAVPPGAVGEMHGHLLYEYKGYSLCVTVSEKGHFICVLITSEPMDRLRHDISLARAFSMVR